MNRKTLFKMIVVSLGVIAGSPNSADAQYLAVPRQLPKPDGKKHTGQLSEYHSSKYEYLVADCTRWIDDNPAAVPSTFMKAGTASYYLKRGNAYYYLRDYGAAINDFNSALESIAELAGYDSSMADIASEITGNDSPALDITAELTSDDSQRHVLCILNCRGNVFCDTGEYKKAIEDYVRVIELYSKAYRKFRKRNWPDVFYRDCWESDYQQAFVNFLDAIQISPENADLLDLRLDITYEKLAAYNKKAINKEDVSECIEAIKVGPKSADGYLLAADLYSRMGSDRRAIDVLTRAAELQPKDAHIHFQCGNAHLDSYLNDQCLKDAVDSFTRAIGLRRAFHEAYNNRGVAYERLGEFGKATKDYEAATSLAPSEQLYKDNLRIVRARMTGRSLSGSQDIRARLEDVRRQESYDANRAEDRAMGDDNSQY